MSDSQKDIETVVLNEDYVESMPHCADRDPDEDPDETRVDAEVVRPQGPSPHTWLT